MSQNEHRRTQADVANDGTDAARPKTPTAWPASSRATAT
jgi:hypothetical protein